MNVAIIGGTGKMGQWMKAFFERHGCRVVVTGRKTKLTSEKAAASADVVVLSVSLEAMEETIKRIGPLVKEESLLMDVASIKTGPLQDMLHHCSCSVLGTHPVFGPTVSSFLNQAMVLCPGRGREWQEWLTRMLLKEGAKVKISTPEKHDRMMALVQVTTHFSSIVLGKVGNDLGIDIMESQDFASPVYKIQLDLVGRILSQSPDLYADIALQNPQSKKAIKAYVDGCKELFSHIKNNDKEGFMEFFIDSGKSLGNFKQEAFDYSDYLIEMLVRKKKKKGEVMQ